MNRSVINDQTLNSVSCCVNTLSHFCVTSFIYPLFLGWISLALRTTTEILPQAGVVIDSQHRFLCTVYLLMLPRNTSKVLFV